MVWGSPRKQPQTEQTAPLFSVKVTPTRSLSFYSDSLNGSDHTAANRKSITGSHARVWTPAGKLLAFQETLSSGSLMSCGGRCSTSAQLSLESHDSLGEIMHYSAPKRYAMPCHDKMTTLRSGRQRALRTTREVGRLRSFPSSSPICRRTT